MIDIGHFSLASAWILSVYGLVAGVIGAKRRNLSLRSSAANSVYAMAFFTIAALIALGVSFMSHDYRYTYVWQHSNNSMPALYRISAVWGGMDGSMLLWAGMMAFFSALVVYRSEIVERELVAWVVPVLSGATSFFLFVVAFLTNPFRFNPGGLVPPDGNGLNPLLQNPSMLIHPPCLYAGFTGFVVPFAFSLAALLSGRLSDHWILVTRRWTLVAWAFLTTGIILGGNWAYIELGWGGFWAWDPVENASFLPWLTATAYLHSVMVQERRGMLKIWNVSLSAVTYLLTVFGTFLTRSGIVQSVHAFAETDVGWVFLAYLAALIVLSMVLIIYRWQLLRPEHSLESFFSREAVFLFNNLLLLGIAFAVFWGVMFPVLSEAFSGDKSVVGPPYFNRVTVPLFLSLLFFMGVGPLLSWRRNTPGTLFKVFLKPVIFGSLVTCIGYALDTTRPLAAVLFGLCMFVTATIFGEFARGARVRRELTGEPLLTGALQLVRRKPRRYGGLIIHLGVVVMAVSITASSVYKIEKDFDLAVGERYAVGRYSLELAALKQEPFPNYSSLKAQVKVYDASSQELLGELNPEKRFYPRNEDTTTEVDIRMTPREDLYLALAGLETDVTKNKAERAIMKVFVNPLQVWVWFGGVIMLLGTFAVFGERVISPATMESRERSQVPVSV